MGTAKGRYRGGEAAAVRFPRFIASLERVSDWRLASCAEWTGKLNKDGYQVIFWEHKSAIASRVSFFLTRGHYPLNLACHHCHNRRCVHPDHVYDGSVVENTRDRLRRGCIDADRVRDLRINGVRCLEGAKYLGISHAQFSRLSRGVSQYCG
jgi:hypothetical protein